MKKYQNLKIRCPHCGIEHTLRILVDTIVQYNYEEPVECSCDEKFKVEYDVVLAKVVIKYDKYLE
jgi:hypothetical protein